nr:CoA transferase [Streptomyces durbertensis]
MNTATAPASAVWSLLGGDSRWPDRLRYTGRPGLPARLPVAGLAATTVGVCALAAAEFAGARGAVTVDEGAVAAAFTSERLLRVDGRAVSTFAPLSHFWRTADGWLRTHANYPHHRARLLTALGVAERGDEAATAGAVERRLAGLRAAEAAELVQEAGGLAVAVRDASDWLAHPQGAAVAGRPLVRRDPLADGPAPPPGSRPRVLDLTRVIAGPVATRTLALLGADVLRVDSPGLPELADAHADTGFGKRSTLLDLNSPADRREFDGLLDQAHVVVTGYRPGALDRYGLDAASLAERRPGLVVAQLSAWGEDGPWGGRRGFDSLVQAACGIAVRESPGDRVPGALPAQALDHGTGYLLAAAVLRALSDQHRGRAGAVRLRFALARTAHWLQHELPASPGGSGWSTPAEDGGSTERAAAWLAERPSPLGALRYVRSPVGYPGGPEDWARPPGVPGSDPPSWA